MQGNPTATVCLSSDSGAFIRCFSWATTALTLIGTFHAALGHVLALYSIICLAIPDLARGLWRALLPSMRWHII